VGLGERKLLKRIVSGIMLTLLLTSMLMLAFSVRSDSAQYYDVFLTIHRVGLVDPIENPWLLEFGADWTVKVLFYNGEVWDEKTVDGPWNNDNPILDATITWKVDLLRFQNVTFKIQLYERDGWGLLPPDVADISAYPGGGYDDYNGTFPRGATYVGYYNLVNNTLTGDYVQFDGSYYRTSGNFDGSVDVDENDADLWFKITDTYGITVRKVPEDYSTIQAAIDAAIPGAGEIVRVSGGIHNEGITVGKSSLEIIGTDGAVIDSGGGTVVFITGNNVKFSNFRVQGGSNYGARGIAINGNYTVITGNTIVNNFDGIYLNTAHSYVCWNLIANNSDSAMLAVSGCINDTLIGNNVLDNEGYGIELYSWEGGGNLVKGNTIQNNSYCGLSVEFSNNNYIQGNYIKNNPNEGMTLLYSGHNTLRENFMEGNKYNFGVRAHDFLNHFIQDIDTSNFVDGKPIYYWANKTGGQIPSDAGYVGIVNSVNVEVKNIEITKNLQGVLLAFTTNSVVSNVSVVQNKWGMHLFFSNGNLIFHNNIINNTHQAYDTNASRNDWHHPMLLEGNYWSDYAGVDDGSGVGKHAIAGDGIGDTLIPHPSADYDFYPLMNPWVPPDIAIVNIITSKTIVGQGYSITLNVTVENQGGYAKTFNVTLYANTTVIATFTNVTLTSRNSTTITFTWNTTGFAKGNYTISAYAWPVQGETETEDNTFPDGSILVTIPGDINGDNFVNYLDGILLGSAFSSRPGELNWNPNADIDCNGFVNYLDGIILGANFSEHW
jgi:parallel beta-helix repeat protein